MAAHSGTPRPRKLALKEKQRVALLHAPAFVALLGPLPEGVNATTTRGRTGVGGGERAAPP